MALIFLGKQHEESFINALKKANATTGDRTIQTVLYVLTAMPSVAQRLDYAFDFRAGYVNAEFVNRNRLSVGERILFGLAMNLYNGYQLDGVPTNPYQAMGMIDTDHRRVYLSAIEYRFV